MFSSNISMCMEYLPIRLKWITELLLRSYRQREKMHKCLHLFKVYYVCHMEFSQVGEKKCRLSGFKDNKIASVQPATRPWMPPGHL